MEGGEGRGRRGLLTLHWHAGRTGDMTKVLDNLFETAFEIFLTILIVVVARAVFREGCEGVSL